MEFSTKRLQVQSELVSFGVDPLEKKKKVRGAAQGAVKLPECEMLLPGTSPFYLSSNQARALL